MNLPLVAAAATALTALGSVLGPATPPDARAALVLQLPGRDWALRVDPPDFEFGRPWSSADGTRMWAAGDGTRVGLTLNVALEPGSADDAAGCRDALWQRVTQDERGRRRQRAERRGRPTVEYVVLQHAGLRVDQRHVHAFLFRDGYCIELHLSLLDPRRAHERRIEDVLGSAALIDAADVR